MTGRYRHRLLVTFWSLCCLLFSQWAVASHVCASLQPSRDARAPVLFAAVLADHADGVAAHPCHGDQTSDAPDEGTAVCMKHCADESGAAGGGLSVAAVATAPPPVLRTLVLDAPAPVHWVQAPARANATAPPLSILYCVSRT